MRSETLANTPMDGMTVVVENTTSVDVVEAPEEMREAFVGATVTTPARLSGELLED